MKTIVVGGGPSGIMAAIKASEHGEVTIIEKNSKLGKKILITGNGKCNFWNECIDETKYNEEASNLIKNTLKYESEVYNFLLNNIGISTTHKDSCIYPRSKSAASIVTALEKNIQKRDINVLYNLSVTDIEDKENEIEVYLSDNTVIRADKVILACGSKSASKTGSDGSIYKILSKKGINITDITPSLVPLIIDNQIKNIWSGVRTDAKLSLYKDSRLVHEETGEIQLTDKGISGIVTFNISGKVAYYLKNNINFQVTIDFVPEMEEQELIKYLDTKCNNMKAETIEELFETIFNYKLTSAMLSAIGLKKDNSWSKISNNDKEKFVSIIKRFPINIIDTEDFEKSQVCHGGVELSEIDEYFTLKRYKNIKVVGETLNVDGICGGFNIAFAFLSGYIGGSSVND